MNYFLAKTDPDTYSIDDFEREHRTVWDGVKNPRAVSTIRTMRPGDRVFIYHSGDMKAVVALATVRSAPRDDPKEPRSAVVELEFSARLATPVTLKEIKESGRFNDWALVRQGRLSTMPAPAEFDAYVREKNPGAKL